MDRLNLISVKDRLEHLEMSIFSVRDFVRIFNVLPKTARAFLSHHSSDNSFRRLKLGVYILPNNPPTKFELANYVHKPSYISFETALSYYGIIPETVYSITSATTNISKEFDFLNQSYRYSKLKKKLFFGYFPLKIRDRLVLIADKEKALLDYLYLASLKKQQINERLNLDQIDRKKLGRYINFFKKNIRKINALINLIENLNL